MFKKNKIIRTLTDFPHLNKYQIADRVGCHAAYVSQVQKEWRKEIDEAERQAEMFTEVEPADVQNLNIDTVLAERGSRYGKFLNHAAITQTYKHQTSAFLEARGKVLTPDQQEALDMIFHKIGRIVNGDPDYADSWVDIAGYAKLVADRLEGKSV
jgi:hypothetical protein